VALKGISDVYEEMQDEMHASIYRAKASANDHS